MRFLRPAATPKTPLFGRSLTVGVFIAITLSGCGGGDSPDLATIDGESTSTTAGQVGDTISLGSDEEQTVEASDADVDVDADVEDNQSPTTTRNSGGETTTVTGADNSNVGDGAGDGGNSGQLPRPAEVIAAFDEAKAEAIVNAAEDEDVAILAVTPIDVSPSDEEVGVDDDERRDPSGRLITLDEPASLACARIELAIDAIDGFDDDGAGELLGQAAGLAAESATDGITEWAEVLEAESSAESVDPVVVVAFLETCVAAGYDL